MTCTVINLPSLPDDILRGWRFAISDLADYEGDAMMAILRSAWFRDLPSQARAELATKLLAVERKGLERNLRLVGRLVGDTTLSSFERVRIEAEEIAIMEDLDVRELEGLDEHDLGHWLALHQ